MSVIKKYLKQIHIVFFICMLFAVAGLISVLVKTRGALREADSRVQELSMQVIEKDGVIDETLSSLEVCIGEKDDISDSLALKEAELMDAQSALAREQLYEARAQLLAKDEGNDYSEEIVFDKVVYLTFDDGPSERTIKILDILDKYNVKATFFVNYHEDAAEKGIYKMITDKGHSIGNHTYDHSYPIEDWDEFLESLFKMEDFIYEQTGIRTRIIRFPGGSSAKWNRYEYMCENIEALTDMGYIYFDWNLTNHDADTRMGYIGEDRMMELLRAEAPGRDKLMLLMHDRESKYSTVGALDEVIEYFIEKGYVFLPITKYSYNPQHFSLTEDG